MTQTRSDSPILLLIEQVKTKAVNTDEDIEEFKTLNGISCQLIIYVNFFS